MPTKRDSWFRGLTKAKMEQLEREAEIGRRLAYRNRVQPFVLAFRDDIGTLLASTPFDRWPDFAVNAFKHTSRQHPAAAQEYRNNLPTK